MPDRQPFVASYYGPVTYGPCPVLVFRQDEKGRKHFVAYGSVQDANPDRIVLKRIVLSGHPYKMTKRSAVVRFMFFNKGRWFIFIYPTTTTLFIHFQKISSGLSLSNCIQTVETMATSRTLLERTVRLCFVWWVVMMHDGCKLFVEFSKFQDSWSAHSTCPSKNRKWWRWISTKECSRDGNPLGLKSRFLWLQDLQPTCFSGFRRANGWAAKENRRRWNERIVTIFKHSPGVIIFVIVVDTARSYKNSTSPLVSGGFSLRYLTSPLFIRSLQRWTWPDEMNAYWKWSYSRYLSRRYIWIWLLEQKRCRKTMFFVRQVFYPIASIRMCLEWQLQHNQQFSRAMQLWKCICW